MFSNRSRIPAGENRISRAIGARRASGANLIDLTLSNPTAAGLPYPPDLLNPLAAPAARSYRPDPRGHEQARRAIAAYHATDGGIAETIDPELMWLTSGTSEAYGMLFKLLCDPGDEVLVPQPGYPLFEHLARLEGVRTQPYPLGYDGRWYIDVAAVRRAVGPRTRALVCISPNNPTGSYLKHDELSALGSLGLPIISDEVFAAFPLEADPSRVPSALACTDVPVFALGGLSKAAGLPQLKLSWIALGGHASDHGELSARLDLISDCYLSVGTPVQVAIAHLLAASEPVRDAIRRRLAANYAQLRKLCDDASPITALHVEGGWYAILRLPETSDEESWVLRMLAEADLIVQPGFFFDLSAGVHLVLSLLTPEADFARGTARIAQVVAGAVR